MQAMQPKKLQWPSVLESAPGRCSKSVRGGQPHRHDGDEDDEADDDGIADAVAAGGQHDEDNQHQDRGDDGERN